MTDTYDALSGIDPKTNELMTGTTTLSYVEVLQPTLGLRFKLNNRGQKILQQSWVCVETNKIEWRDVPLVEAELSSAITR